MSKRSRKMFEEAARELALSSSQERELLLSSTLTNLKAVLKAEKKSARKREKSARKREKSARKRENALQKLLDTSEQDLAIRKRTAAISRSHAEASEVNSGCLETCSIDAILEGVPQVDEAVVRACYEAVYIARPTLPTADDIEIPIMHDFFLELLRHARPATSELVVRHESKARVGDSQASVIPDISLSHRRNASFSMHTLDFSLELKRRKKRRLILKGNAESMDYATRKAGTRRNFVCRRLLLFFVTRFRLAVLQSTHSSSSSRVALR
jgi:hypothetical protein